MSDDLREEIAAIDQAVMALGFDLNREAVTEAKPKSGCALRQLGVSNRRVAEKQWSVAG